MITTVEPREICPLGDNAPDFVFVHGSGFVVRDDHTVASSVQLWRNGHLDVKKQPMLEPDLEGRTLTLAFVSGESAQADGEPPAVFEVRVVNPDGKSATLDGTFSIHSSFGFTTINPISASSGSLVTMTLTGRGFYGPMRVVLEAQLAKFATDVQVLSPTSVTAQLDLASVPPGTYAVTMRNAGGCGFTRVSAFTVTP